MKIHVLSDLHCEFAPFEPYQVREGASRMRVVCNPRDYPLRSNGPRTFENSMFDPSLIVEV